MHLKESIIFGREGEKEETKRGKRKMERTRKNLNERMLVGMRGRKFATLGGGDV